MAGRQRRFQAKTNHEISKKLVAKALDWLFYANDLFPCGCLLLVHARRKS